MSDQDINQFFADRMVSQPTKSGDFARVLFFLHQESTDAVASGGVTPVKDFVRQLIQLSNDVALDSYLETLVKDTKTAEKDAKFRKVMQDLYNSYNSQKNLGDGNESSALNAFNQVPHYLPQIQMDVGVGAAAAFALVPKEELPGLLTQLETCLPNGTNWLTSSVRGTGTVAKK